MKGIKKRVFKSFMLIIIISIVVLEGLLINFVQKYYYNNVEVILTNQIKMSADFYSRYFSNSSLEDNVLDDLDIFWKQTPAQVQIIDLSGKVLMDSIGVIPKKPINSNDFTKAAHGNKGTWIGKVDYCKSNVMAVTYPLKADDKIVGVLRFITSLEGANKDIRNVSFILISIGLIVVLISGTVSLFIADTIINPIKEVTGVAEKMASGNLNVRSHKKIDDEIGKLSDTLNFMAEEILKKDQLKNEFISSVSHELRTPLTSIKGWAITLNAEQLDDKEILGDGLKIIEQESERLTKMVEELLDFSKFVSGKVNLNKEEGEIPSLVKFIERYMEPRAVRENIDFVVECEENLPTVSIDRNRISQVLINVLDNAFKFTPQGGKVEFKTIKEKNFITMVIQDTGCGISKEELPRVKEKFYKGKSSKSQNGIGLSICDEIMKLHEGKLEIESELNKGTTVLIKIPL